MKKISKWAGFLLLFIIITIVAGFLARNPVAYFILEKGTRFYAGRAGIDLETGRISGDLLTHTTVEQVLIHPEEGEKQLFDFKAQAIDCSYDLWSLKKGYEKFLQGLHCTADMPEFTYDQRLAADQQEPDEDPGQFFIPAPLPSMDLNNGSVILLDTGWDAKLTGINANLRSEGSAHELKIAAEWFRFNREGRTMIDTGFSAKLQYAEERLTVESLEMGDRQIRAAGFVDLAQLDKEHVEFEADVSFDDSSLSLSGSWIDQLLRAHAGTDNFDVAELLKRLGAGGLDVSGKIRGEADLAVNLETLEQLDSSFSLSFMDGMVSGITVERVAAAGFFDNRNLKVSSAELRTFGNHILVKDFTVPMPLLQEKEIFPILRHSQAEFSADVTDFKTLRQLFGIRDDMLPDLIMPESMTVRGHLGDGILFLEQTRAAAADLSLAIDQATIPVPATLEKLKTITADHGAGEAETVSSSDSFGSEILRIVSAEAETSGNRIRISDVSVPMPLLVHGKTLSIIGGAKTQFAADITDFEILLRIAGIREDVLPELIRPDSVTINGYLEDGVLHIESGRVVTTDSNLTVGKATIPIPATKEKFESVPIDLAARIESRSLQKITGLFGDIAVNGQAAADIIIAGSIRKPEASISLTGEYLSFKEMQLGGLSLQGDIRLLQESYGVIKSIEFEVTELSQENGTGILALLAPMTGTWKDDTFSMSGVFQLDGKGEIAAGVSRAQGKEVALEISTRGLDSDGWLGNYIAPGFFFHGADIEAVLLGGVENTQLQLSGTVSEAGATDVDFPLTGSFNLRYSSKGIEIEEFTWRSMERNQLTITGFVPYDPMAEEPFLKGELSLAGYIDFPSLEDVAVFLEPWGIGNGSLDLDMELTGSWEQPLGNVIFQVENLEPLDKMRKFIESPVDVSVDITAQDDTIVLKLGSLESTQYAVQATGTWQHDISVKELLRKGKRELQGEVNGNIAVQLKAMNFLRRNLPWLRRLEGDMRGEVHVSGPISKPILKGSFSLEDGEASHTFNFPMLSAVNLQGVFDENSITISEMQAEVGGSPVNLNGRIDMVQKAVNVNLHVNGRNVLLFRNNDMLMRGDVLLDVTGPLDRLLIKGTTGLTNGYYTRNIDFLSIIGTSSTPVSEGVDFLFSFQDPPLNKAVLDIRITTVEPLRVRTRLIRSALRPELSLKGTGELPFLVGTVYIDSTRVLLPSGRLQVQSGLLRFLEGRPDRPELDLIAQSKLLGYDINVVTKGPLDDLVITLSSSPALPNEELMLLLLTGQPPKDDIAAGAQSKASTNVMVYLGRDFLGKWLEDENGTGDETILDRFELDFGRDVTKSGDETVESSFRLSKQTTGKGRIYYLTGEKDKYDAYNYGLKLVFHFE